MSPDRAFVLMPFDAEFDSIFEDLIKPALEEAGYDVARADTPLDQQNILRDIVRGIGTANLIVADLTTLNANVLYELGLAHGLGIPTVLIAQSIEELPFDLRSYRVTQYSTHFSLAGELKTALKDVAEKHVANEISFGSPVTDFLQPEDVPSKQRGVQEPLNQEAEKGLYDFVVEGMEASQRITQAMDTISQETGEIGRRIKEHGNRLQKAQGSEAPGTAARVHKMLMAAGNDLVRFSERVDDQVPTLERDTDLMIESYTGLASWLASGTPEQVQQLPSVRNMINGLVEGAQAGLEGARNFREATRSIPAVSRAVAIGSRRVVHTLDRIIAALEKLEAFGVKVVASIDERLAKSKRED